MNAYFGTVRSVISANKYGVMVPAISDVHPIRADDYTLDTESPASIDVHVHAHAAIAVGETVVVLDMGSGSFVIVGRKV